MDHPLRIGLIGANAERSWAKLSHIPAIKALPGITLAALATSNVETARVAGRAFAVDECHGNAIDLIRSPNVDVVSVGVKVLYHNEIGLAALDAGKHVLCEWPLALGVEEARAIAVKAEQTAVHAAIGLQARFSPAVRRARDIIARGGIGRPLTCSTVSTTEGHGPQVPASYAYLCDPANGATMSTILTGHTLDLAIFLLGGISEINALTAIKYKSVKLIDGPGHVARSTADYLAVQARFHSGCMLSAEMDGGRSGATPFAFEVLGTEGSVRLRGGHPYGFQAGDLYLETTVPSDAPDPPAAPELTGPLANVGELYARFAQDIRNGEKMTPDFRHALELHNLIGSVGTAAASGRRQTAGDWPDMPDLA